MAASKPVALCTHLLSSGKLCRGIAVRSERYCRSHIRNYRLLERARAETEALDRLAAKVACMDLEELLSALHSKLEDLNRAYNLGRFPEVRYLLTVAIDELCDLKYSESNVSPQPEPNQMPSTLDPNRVKQMPAPIPGIKQIAETAIL